MEIKEKAFVAFTKAVIPERFRGRMLYENGNIKCDENGKAIITKGIFQYKVTLTDEIIDELSLSIEGEDEKLFLHVIQLEKDKGILYALDILNGLIYAYADIRDDTKEYAKGTEEKRLREDLLSTIGVAIDLIISTIGVKLKMIFPQEYIDDYARRGFIAVISPLGLMEFYNKENASRHILDNNIEVLPTTDPGQAQTAEALQKEYNIDAPGLPQRNNDNTQSNTQGVVNRYGEKVEKDIFEITKIYSYCIDAKYYTFKDVAFDFFRDCIIIADFKALLNENGAIENQLKYIIYRLSDLINQQWYQETAESIGATKQKCSGAISKDTEWRKWIDGHIGKVEKRKRT
ncbi:hypothetical protein Barb6XT_00783 [Bacteroidales bacterium Barb6XT]|nr:hypothetical protein Barb6XT_00783 [Bacteroidales bacterium Barb6XT]